ncbi:MAG: L-threonylcarbamoyladenylate synthase [Patescibacteria group bacterium]|jgi:L-threonylcarbamoyladenylate synthase
MLIVKPSKKGIDQAVRWLRAGGVIVYPTDTAYGLGGVIGNPAVVRRVLRIKKRRDRKFTVVCADLNQAKKFFRLNKLAARLAKKYWPGPLSIVVSSSFSIRVPANKLTQKLVKLAGRPLIATSANLSGNAAPYSGRVVIKEFKNQKNQPDLVINSGKLKKTSPSTIVKIRGEKIEVLRQGSVKIL